MSDSPSPQAPDGEQPPPHLRFLKILTTVLAGTMIVGRITIVALIVIRFPAAHTTGPALPPGITLPADASAEAVTFGRGWVAVVTDQDRILIFDAKTGALRQTVAIVPVGE